MTGTMDICDIVNRVMAVTEALGYQDFANAAEERVWMETNYFGAADDAWGLPPDARPASVADCAALLRWLRFKGEDHIEPFCDLPVMAIFDNVIRYLEGVAEAQA